MDFAFIKATEGSGYVDEYFYDNWQGAAKTDLYVGAFWQYTDRAVLEGYTRQEKYIDMNVFRGNPEELKGGLL